MKRLTLTLILLLLATPAWPMSAVYRHLEPETVTYDGLPSAVQAQFTTNENIKTIKYVPNGSVTLTGITANLSQVNGTAFVSNPSVDLRPYIGFKGTWSDVGTAGVGFFGAAGTGETLDVEKITALVNFTSDTFETFVTSGRDVTSAINITGFGSFGSTNSATIAGALYLYTTSITINSGVQVVLLIGTSSGVNSFWNGSQPTSAAGAGSLYATAVGTTTRAGLGTPSASATNLSALNNSLKQVLAPSATGTKILNAVGGAQNWATVGSTPNPATFTVLVTKN